MKLLIILQTVLLMAATLVTVNAKDFNSRPVVPEQLYALINRANHIIVKMEPFKDSKIIFESTDVKDITGLKDSIILQPQDGWFHCMCIGTPAIYLYNDQKLLLEITNHHGLSIRTSIWTSDARISDIQKWLKWFDDRGIDSPRKEYEDSIIRQKKAEKDYEKWINMMPMAIKPYWDEATKDPWNYNIALLENALKKKVKKTDNQIMELLAWYGSGAGPWSGFPMYEEVACKLLLKYPTSEIITAIRATELTETHIEGAARLFGGWSFNKQRPDDLKLLPNEYKELFWNHVKKTNDKDKYSRAERAFSK